MATEEHDPEAGAGKDSEVSPTNDPPAPLQPGEHITDHAITKAEDDRFGHRDIVAELAELALRGPGKTNIALFAPWGTGKSGIAEMLREKIGKRAHFAYFDAFKHRETPLRRAFLRAVAEGVGKTPESTDQYFKEQSRRVLDDTSRINLFAFVGKSLFVGLVLMAVVTAVLAAIKSPADGKNYGDAFVNVFLNLGGIAAFIAAMIGVIAAAASEGLGYTETTTPPSEDDQFEDGFTALIQGKGRVVVFVDELDRCNAEEVVETLETLRVFLDVKDCVFIVAADRRALEQALRNRARQETPFDESHPYFSSGGSYIDKIFQTQLSLPQVRARDMTEFAQLLTAKAPGTWAILRDWEELGEVIGALIPTHVRAPRQVKVLLNAYLVAHRIAAQRVADGRMKAIEGRAAALAQLVCLRIEFPLFAEDLGEFPQLGRAIRARTDEPATDLSGDMPRTWNRAGEYLSLRAPLAPLIVKPQGRALPTLRDPDSGTTDPESVPVPSPDPDTDEEQDATEATQIALRRLDNLRSYLNRVRSLPDVERDLVYLHSAATTETELEPATADRLDQLARDGDVEPLESVLQPLGADRHSDVITVLVGALDDAKVPVDAANATRVLFAAIDHLPDLASADADRVARAVGLATGRGTLERDFRASAVTLAARCSPQLQRRLLARVGSADGAMDKDVRFALLANAERLPRGHELVVRAVDLSIVRRAGVDGLAALPADLATDLAKRGVESFVARRPTFKPPTPREGEQAVELDQEAERAGRLAAFFDGLVAAHPSAAVEVALGMLAIEEEPSADAVHERRDQLAPVDDPRLATAMLADAKRYDSGAAASMLQVIADSAVDATSDAALDELAADCLEHALDNGPEQDQGFQLLVPELVRLRGGREGAPTAEADATIGDLATSAVTNQAEANVRARCTANVRLLLQNGFANPDETATAFVQGAAASLAAITDPAQPEQDPAAIATDAANQLLQWAADASDDSLIAATDAAVKCPPIANPARVTAMLAAARERRERDDAVPSPISIDDLVALAEAHKADAAEALALWAEPFAVDAESIWRVLSPLWGPDEIPSPLRAASAAAARDLGDEAEAQLVALAIDHALADTTITTHYNNWEAVGLQTASDAVVSNLADRISDQTTAEEWSAYLHVARQASEGHSKVQRKLGNKLLVPLAKTDFSLAVRNLGLVGSENGPKIAEKLEQLATDDAQREELANRVKDLGWAGNWAQRLFGRFMSKPGSSEDDDPDA